MSHDRRFSELGLRIPELPASTPARFVPAVRAGSLVFASGQTPHEQGTLVMTGKLGAGLDVEQGRAASRIAVLNCLAQVHGLLGSLDAVERIIRLTGYVASADGFTDQPLVVNGASELLEEVFGEAGRHARSAIGVAELPGGAPVEVELIVQAREG